MKILLRWPIVAVILIWLGYVFAKVAVPLWFPSYLTIGQWAVCGTFADSFGALNTL